MSYRGLGATSQIYDCGYSTSKEAPSGLSAKYKSSFPLSSQQFKKLQCGSTSVFADECNQSAQPGLCLYAKTAVPDAGGYIKSYLGRPVEQSDWQAWRNWHPSSMEATPGASGEEGLSDAAFYGGIAAAVVVVGGALWYASRRLQMAQLSIYEGAAGISGYESAMDSFGSDMVSPVAPPGGRPPSAPLVAPDVQVPQYGSTGIGLKQVLVGAVVVGLVYMGWKHLSQSPEELAANDDDDGEDYESNSSKSGFMRRMSRNGSEDDEDDEEDEDEDEEDDEDDDEDDDDGEEFAMNASKPSSTSLTPNSAFARHRQSTQRILEKIQAIQASNGA